MGIHPNSSASYAPAMLDELRALAAHPKVVAIGEIGLDYYWHDATWRSSVALRDQLALAAVSGLPVIIHNREADEDVAAELRTWVNRGSSQFAAGGAALCGRAVRLRRGRGAGRGSVRLGFRVELWRAGDVQERTRPASLVPQLRRDRLMLETDAPYLTPHPHRGKRNEPGYVKLVCEQLARLVGVSAAQVAAESTALAEQFFGLEAARGVGNGIAEYTLTRRS